MLKENGNFFLQHIALHVRQLKGTRLCVINFLLYPNMDGQWLFQIKFLHKSTTVAGNKCKSIFLSQLVKCKQMLRTLNFPSLSDGTTFTFVRSPPGYYTPGYSFDFLSLNAFNTSNL